MSFKPSAAESSVVPSRWVIIDIVPAFGPPLSERDSASRDLFFPMRASVPP
jgi:hypothetical protein